MQVVRLYKDAEHAEVEFLVGCTTPFFVKRGDSKTVGYSAKYSLFCAVLCFVGFMRKFTKRLFALTLPTCHVPGGTCPYRRRFWKRCRNKADYKRRKRWGVLHGRQRTRLLEASRFTLDAINHANFEIAFAVIRHPQRRARVSSDY